jgi:NADP-dependent 3-hydroxy acid dehydrogenase YdfG
LTAEDIASLVVYAVTAPERVSISEVLVRPLRQVL